MIEDQIIETYIHNLSVRAPRVIEQHLQDGRFLHMSHMLEELNWIPHLSTLWWKDGDLRHTRSIFHAMSV
ncbi:hypothetical protein J1N35_034458 [Gossypium stocksii]|uniref:Uncharacterized protein n=1 Tax=Gossypium stocksii TaxID=47602 RepID=A0A9D3ZQ77_9ROSI|nr:hypothetical protein J1N35_034458 [Gossypium stocksii]